MQSNVVSKLYHKSNLNGNIFRFLLERLPQKTLYAFSKKDLKLKRIAPAREALLKEQIPVLQSKSHNRAYL